MNPSKEDYVRFNSSAETIEDAVDQSPECESIDANVQNIQLDDDFSLTVYGLKKGSNLRVFILCVTAIFTFGISAVIFFSNDRFRVWVMYEYCSLKIATSVSVKLKYRNKIRHSYLKKIQVLMSGGNCSKRDNDECPVDPQMPFEPVVHVGGGIFKKMNKVRYFNCLKMRFVWDPEIHQFYKLRGPDKDIPASFFCNVDPLSASESKSRFSIIGPNKIVMSRKCLWNFLVAEFLNPLGILLFFSFLIYWMNDYSSFYTTLLVMITPIIITISGFSAYYCQPKLDLNGEEQVEVMEENELILKSAKLLVPGDVLVIRKKDYLMTCDAILISGICIVDESVFTGEKDPVVKIPFSEWYPMYNSHEHCIHTLYCGTKIKQSKSESNKPVFAVVIRTGYFTAMGAVIRTLFYPRLETLNFGQFNFKTISIFLLIASLSFNNLLTKFLCTLPGFDFVKEVLNFIAITVPLASTSAQSIGAICSLSHHEDKHIFSIKPRSVNKLGSVNCVCFNKTGTLTEIDVNVCGVIAARTNSLHTLIQNPCWLGEQSHLFRAMKANPFATTIKKKFCNNSIDLEIFDSTDCDRKIIRENKYTEKVGDRTPRKAEPKEATIRTFPFDMHLQRVSVITVSRVYEEKYYIYSRGTPESIIRICSPNTIARNYNDILTRYTSKGYIVAAAAYRHFFDFSQKQLEKISRKDAETNLIFLGLIILENKLKSETASVISKLNDCNLSTAIITGDHLLTTINVGRSCGIISPVEDVFEVQFIKFPRPSIICDIKNAFPDSPIIPDAKFKINPDSVNLRKSRQPKIRSPKDTVISSDYEGNILRSLPSGSLFAVTGSTWTALKHHLPHLIPLICSKGRIFAHMNPEQKKQVICEMKNLGNVVAMCGEGAGDCSAIRAADAGISVVNSGESFSEELSTINSFASPVPNIEGALSVIMEVKASQLTSVTFFKLLMLSSLTLLISVMILPNISMSSFEVACIDSFIIVLSVFSLSDKRFADIYLKEAPPSSSSKMVVISLLCQALLAANFQFCSIELCSIFVGAAGEVQQSVENMILMISTGQCFIFFVVFHAGPPYFISIKDMLMNRFIFSLICVYLFVFNERISFDTNFKLVIIVFVILTCNFVASLLAEKFLNIFWRRKSYYIEKLRNGIVYLGKKLMHYCIEPLVLYCISWKWCDKI